MKSEAQLLQPTTTCSQAWALSQGQWIKVVFLGRPLKKIKALKKAFGFIKKGQNYVLNLTHDHEYDVMA